MSDRTGSKGLSRLADNGESGVSVEEVALITQSGPNREFRYARNTLINLVGFVTPMFVALLAIPALVTGLGTERFGVLTIAWAAIGYFTLFDLGLSRALTQLVAEQLGKGLDREVPATAWTALLLMLLLGVVGAVVMALSTPFLVHNVLEIPAVLQRETAQAFYLLALSLPAVISTAGLRGLLEANHNFGMVNAIRVPMGILMFVAPLMVLPFTRSLAVVIGALVLTRAVSWVLHLVLCLKALTGLRQGVRFERKLLGVLGRFGGWMTVNSISSTLMVYLDRFLIGSLLTMTAVAYYVTPYEAITKLWLVPGALLGVLFPAFAATYTRDPAHTVLLFDRAFRSVFLFLFPVVLAAVLFANEGLQWWLGQELAIEGAVVLQWLAVGVLINCLGMVPAAGLQAVGRPDITGKLSLVELPVYLVAVWQLVGLYGINGAAMAWTGRVAVDTLALCILADRQLSGGNVLLRRFVAIVVPSAAVLGLAAFGGDLLVRIWIFAGCMIAYAVGLPFVLSRRERRTLYGYLTLRRAELRSSG